MTRDDDAAIPAWQRAQKAQPVTPQDTPEAEPPTTAPTEDLKEVEMPTPEAPAAQSAAEELESQDSDAATHFQHMKTFLSDPAVKDAPLEKKRAFFESKGLPKDQIDRVLASEQSRFSTDDFDAFRQAQSQPPPQPQAQAQAQPQPQPQQQQQTTPPIITYPEFLVEAHKPPPLITPSRLVNTAYAVGGLTALLYGVSKYLVQPMSAGLCDARHDFALHSQEKVDAMNEKLEKMVSKIPAAAASKKDDLPFEDDESETSDPTELYHRDMGTQTSLPSSRSSSPSPDGVEKKNVTTRSIATLEVLHSHIDEMLTRTNTVESANKDKQESLNKLRSYLDGLMYAGSPYGGMWSSTEGAWSEGGDAGAKKENDVVEELKKEIRGVKGVLLSAKRFPGVTGRTGTVGA